jgi:hypothetical protein
MKYAVEMGSGAMKYIRSFIKVGPGIQNLLGGGFIGSCEMIASRQRRERGSRGVSIVGVSRFQATTSEGYNRLILGVCCSDL